MGLGGAAFVKGALETDRAVRLGKPLDAKAAIRARALAARELVEYASVEADGGLVAPRVAPVELWRF